MYVRKFDVIIFDYGLVTCRQKISKKINHESINLAMSKNGYMANSTFNTAVYYVNP